MQDPQTAVGAALRFKAALTALLEVHGVALSERTRIAVDQRPGVILVTEAHHDTGHVPILAIGFDARCPREFGHALALQDE